MTDLTGEEAIWKREDGKTCSSDGGKSYVWT